MEKDVLCECQPREIEPHSTFVSSTLSVYFAFNLQFGKKDNKKNLLLLVIFEEKKKKLCDTQPIAWLELWYK